MWLWILTAISIPLLFGYGMHVMKKKRLAFLNTLAVLLSLCIVTLYTSTFQRGNTSIDSSLYLLDGFSLQVLAIFLFWRCYQSLKQPLTLLLCTEGCIVVYQWKHIQVLHWNAVVSVWNTPVSTKFVCKNGKKVTIAHHWPNATVAREILSGKALRHIRFHVTETFASGAMVPFGACALSQEGVFDGIQTFSWNTIRECEYTDSEVMLIGKDMSCLARFSIANLPNIAVFVSLVNAIAQDRRMPQMLL
jgi:hypothetical protein